VIHHIRLLRSIGIKPRRRKLPRQIHPTHIATDYFKAIRRYLDLARSMLTADLFPRLPAMLEDAKRARDDSMRMDRGKDVNDEIDRIAAKYFDNINVADIERLATETAQNLSAFQRQQLNRQITAAMGVNVLSVEPNLAPRVAAFTAENVALIKSIPTQYFSDVEKRVTAAMRAGTLWPDLAKELQDRYDVSESKAALIARDQAGKFYGELNEARQTALGVEKFIWRTAHDERVRPEHEDLDGETFDWNDSTVGGDTRRGCEL
jgi:SPP1 gp7 family putative phage head morphogenesis protein